MQNLYQPYYNQAQQYFNQSAQPITGAQVSNYMNPYAGYVMGNLQEQQGQQMQQLTGQATQTAGGVGSDRIGVAQGELARQQGLASGQTLASIYGSALGAAQQQQQMTQGAGYGMGQLGGANLNSALQATGALYGSGSYQQQLQQAQLNSQYQNQLQQQAYPFQTAQYLANVTGGLAGAMGGNTTTGQFGTYTPPQPSILGQAAGAGIAGLGLYNAFSNRGGRVGMADGGEVDDSSDGGDSGPGLSMPAAKAPSVNPYRGISWMGSDPVIPSGHTTQAPVHIPSITPLNMQQGQTSGNSFGDILGSVAKIAPLLMANRGGRIGDADGGDAPDFGAEFSAWDPTAGFTARPKDTPYTPPPDVFGDENRRKGSDLLIQGMTEPYRMPGDVQTAKGLVHPTEAMDTYPSLEEATSGRLARSDAIGVPQGRVRLDKAPTRTPGQPTPYDPPQAAPRPKVAAPAPGDEDTPPLSSDIAAKNLAEMKGRGTDLPYPMATHDRSTEIARNPWMAVAMAGLGMMGSGSPFPGVAIGQGGMKGVQYLENQREQARAEETINQRAQQLQLEANKNLDEYTRMTPVDAEKLRLARESAEQGKQDVYFSPNTSEPYLVNKRTGEVQKLNLGQMPGAAPPPQQQPIPPPSVGPAVQAGPAPGTPAAGGSAIPPNATATAGVAPLASQPPAESFGYKGPEALSRQDLAPMPNSFNPKTGQLNSTLGRESQKTLRQAAEANQASTAQLMNLSQIESDLNRVDAANGPTGRILATGPGSETAHILARAVNRWVPGETPVFDPEALGAGEAANKLSVQLGQSQARLLGAREAQQVIQQTIQANPGMHNTPAGRRLLIAGLKSAAERQRDYSNFVIDYAKRRGGDATGAQQAFEKVNPAERYVNKARYDAMDDVTKQRLQQDIPKLIEHRDHSGTVKEFDKRYNGMSKFFLDMVPHG